MSVEKFKCLVCGQEIPERNRLDSGKIAELWPTASHYYIVERIFWCETCGTRRMVHVEVIARDIGPTESGYVKTGLKRQRKVPTSET